MKLLAISSFVNEKKNCLNTAYTKCFSGREFTPLIVPTLYLENREFITEKEDQFILNHCKNIAEKSDGLILSGGGDINPEILGGRNLASENCDSLRDITEIGLIKEFIKVKKPILGICRGFQLLGKFLNFPNFYQDLSQVEELHNALNRDMKARQEPCHKIYFRESLEEYLKSKNVINRSQGLVNSFHHQGFTILTGGKRIINQDKMLEALNRYTESIKNITIIAHTQALIEGFESKNLPIMGVQWHPEEYGENSLILNYFMDKFFS